MNIIKLILTSIIVSFLIAVSCGTILWLTYPQIYNIFPKMMDQGYMPYHLDLWTCISISWLINVLFKNPNFKTENKFIVKDEEK